MTKFDKKTTCAFTGHRYLGKDFDINILEEEINKAIDKNYETFLVGMAVGFDSECFRLLEKIRKKKNIKIIACIPCVNQSDKFTKVQKEEYSRMVDEADEKIVLSDKYFVGCMQVRNRFMVDNSSLVIAYLREMKGGTYSTVKYAKNKETEVIII